MFCFLMPVVVFSPTLCSLVRPFPPCVTPGSCDPPGPSAPAPHTACLHIRFLDVRDPPSIMSLYCHRPRSRPLLCPVLYSTPTNVPTNERTNSSIPPTPPGCVCPRAFCYFLCFISFLSLSSLSTSVAHPASPFVVSFPVRSRRQPLFLYLSVLRYSYTHLPRPEAIHLGRGNIP
ncbi:hypothetical protein C8Q70DRAFT_233295 [Cubamyces menziesii]|nr:hypothetical protein C8Q70DRAFT_233295 [Cubamyces menziesii]